MIKINFIIAVVFLQLIIVTNLSAQRNFSQEADKAFYDRQYYLAIDKYKKAYSKVKSNRFEKYRILFQIGECYRYLNDTKRTESQYKRLIRVKFEKHEPKLLLYYADALKANGNYEEAIIYYEKYKVAVPEDPRGEIGVESSILSQKWIENPTRYLIVNEKKINSRQNDWCPYYADKKSTSIIFTSPREGATGNKTDSWTGESFTDIFIVAQDRKGNWSNPSLLDKGNMVNTIANEGPACFDKKFNTLYFTRCGYDKKEDMGCKIYTSTKKGKGWSEPVMLNLVPDSVDAIHPSVSDDELTIYFCSNLPGGQGDMDIWMAKREKKNKDFGKPVNMGPHINTPDKDEFPYIRNDTTFYFASKGHPGMGSYDIFVTTRSPNGEWRKPENLKHPVNSPGDDFGIVFHPSRDEGYFTSNRKGGRGGDDIYSFVLPPLVFTLKGNIIDEKTLKPVADATVKLEGSDGSMVEIKSDADGTYFFDSKQIMPAVTYEVKFSKDDYFSTSDRLSTVALENSKDFVTDIILIPIEKKPIVLPEILYDFAKWDIKPQYQDSLTQLIQILEENPNIVIELLSHTDMVGTQESNLDLSQKRAQSVIDYLISRGIDSRRLKAIGYGKNMPRVLTHDITRGAYTFSAGTVLTEEYIKSMPSVKKQAVANQLNRRTEFRVISDDFAPESKPTAPAAAPAAAAAAAPAPAPAAAPAPASPAKTIPLYTIQVAAGDLSLSQFSNLEDVRKCTGKDGITRIVSGAFQSREEAVQYVKKVKALGYNDAWPVKVDENRKACFE